MSYQVVPHMLFQLAVRDWGERFGFGNAIGLGYGDFGCIYIAKSSKGMVKIGFSQNVEKRVKALPGKCELLFIVPDVFWSEEYWLHGQIAYFVCKKDGATEWYEETGPIAGFLDEIREKLALASSKAPALLNAGCSVVRHIVASHAA